MKKFILFFSISCCCLKTTHAQIGEPDPSFGSRGIVTSNFGKNYNYGGIARKVLLQPDGGMYVVFLIDDKSIITKRHANGSADISYGKDGFSVSAPAGYYADAAIQRDGKIVVSGSGFRLGRYNTDGSLDATFSADGKQTTDFGSELAVAKSVAIQSDGKIVVVGYTHTGPDYYANDFALARYNTDGSLDNTFSDDGKQTTDFGSSDIANSVAIQNDGKIVVAGFSLIARYNIDGSLDKTFSDDGKQIAPFSDRSGDWTTDVTIQPDGKIVVAGTYNNSNIYNIAFGIARYNSDGSFDNTFSNDGIQTTDFGSSFDKCEAVAIQPDGKIVVGGATGSVFALARYNIDGSLDNTFSEDGKQTSRLTGMVNSIAIQNNGKIVAAGSAFLDRRYIGVARYKADGSLDKTFNGSGKLITGFKEKNTGYNSTAIQKDGKIVAGGRTWNGQNYDFAVARYNTNGGLDNTFNGIGVRITDFGNDNYVRSVALQPDGKIVAAGSAFSGGKFNFALARYNTDGSLDNTFSGDGKQTTSLVGSNFAMSVALQSDGKIVVGGYTNVYTGGIDFSIARYNPDGTLDNTFSEDGIQTTDFGSSGDYLTSIAIQSDGKIVACGNSNSDFALARYNSDGSLDNSFSDDGLLIADFSHNYDNANSIAIQSDGKIVAAGYVFTKKGVLFGVARFNTDGSWDNSFDHDGKQIIDFTFIAKSVAIQKDGKIVVAGSSIVRLNPDGSLDKSFSHDGKQKTEAFGGEGIESIAIAKDKLYAVGSGTSPVGSGIIARFLLDDKHIPPAISISIPGNVVKYTASDRIKINAAATDEDGTITKVQFYNGTTLLHTEDAAPYGFLWVDVPAGNYTFTAKATDNSGNVTTSNSIKISVTDKNTPPVVNIVNPVADTTYTGPATIRLIANTKDSNDRISKVEFYNGTALLRTEYYYPYTYSWTNVQSGAYNITAKAYNDKGHSAISAPVNLTVTNASIVSRPSTENIKTDLNGLSLTLNPNPARSTLQISTKGLQPDKPSVISVISSAGVVMKTIQSNASNKVVQLNVSSLVSGVYTLKVVSGDNVSFKQFVKL